MAAGGYLEYAKMAIAYG